VNLQALDDRIIVKVYNSDKELKITSKGGIITSHPLKPTLDLCQIGECLSVGRNINYIKEGEIVLYSWYAEDGDEQLLDKDEEGEFRYITERQIYGSIKINKKNNYSHIQPKKDYILAIPTDEDFAETKFIFQIPVSAINPQDAATRKMVKPNDWIIVMPNCAVPITVKRQSFWLIHRDDILCVNRGQHRIAINRKRVSDKIRMASRKETVQLN
jgi:co-chaperonin GroES (HSP10)